MDLQEILQDLKKAKVMPGTVKILEDLYQKLNYFSVEPVKTIETFSCEKNILLEVPKEKQIIAGIVSPFVIS